MRRFLCLLMLPIVFLSCSGGKEGGDFEARGMSYATNLSISPGRGYVAVTVRDPWDTLKIRQRYILVDRNAPLPDTLPDGVVIPVPVRRAAVYSSVHVSMMEHIGALDCIAGVCDAAYINSDTVRERIGLGIISDLGLSASPSVELLVDSDMDCIIASPFKNAGYGAVGKTGIPIVEAADYMENLPLGRTEWIKFFGLLSGRTEAADSLFDATVERYNALCTLASKAESRPRVLMEKKYGPSWDVSGGDSYLGRMLSDAAADYVFSDLRGAGTVNMNFEAVYDKACEADVWLMKYNRTEDYSYSALEDEYKPYSGFKPFRLKNIWICNTACCSYYEDISVHPDYLLSDFISIFHPELSSDSLRFYRKMPDN